MKSFMIHNIVSRCLEKTFDLLFLTTLRLGHPCSRVAKNGFVILIKMSKWHYWEKNRYNFGFYIFKMAVYNDKYDGLGSCSN